jgi:uncharacterized membrane protein
VLRVVVPGRDLSYYLELATGQARRYGCVELRVDHALLRVLGGTGHFCVDPGDRRRVAAHVRLVAEAAETSIRQTADLTPVRERAERILAELDG